LSEVFNEIRADTSSAYVTFVIGGARSGKSAYAERLIAGMPGERIYIATAEPGDAEMAERIAEHRRRRDGTWRTVEEPLDLADALLSEAGEGRAVLVDCLTIWLSNLIAAERAHEEEEKRLVDALSRVTGPVVLISNEVGLGIVPDNALARSFRDLAGRLNQRIAAAADRVVFLAAGLPLTFKQPEESI
jgi:adenosylcobinamide kinase/adenosylcobinamide-phosphate guanylyltransferase